MKKYIKFLIPVIVIIAVLLVYFLKFKKDDDEINEETKTYTPQIDEELENSKIVIFQMETDDIYAFSYTDQNGQELHFKIDSDKWVLEEDTSLELDQDLIQQILEYMSTIRATQILDNVNPDDYGITDATVEYTISDASENLTSIKISTKYEDNGEYYYVINDNYEYVYQNDSTIMIPTNYDLEVLVK